MIILTNKLCRIVAGRTKIHFQPLNANF